MKTSTKYLLVASIVIISVLNLKINFHRTESGSINLNSLSISSINAYSEGGGTWYPHCRCHTSNMTCQEGNAWSIRHHCNCFYTTVCRN